MGNTHPRFFGWVHGAGNPGGVLPELVGAALNANCGGRDHAAIYVEKQVLAWCRAIVSLELAQRTSVADAEVNHREALGVQLSTGRT